MSQCYKRCERTHKSPIFRQTCSYLQLCPDVTASSISTGRSVREVLWCRRRKTHILRNLQHCSRKFTHFIKMYPGSQILLLFLLGTASLSSVMAKPAAQPILNGDVKFNGNDNSLASEEESAHVDKGAVTVPSSLAFKPNVVDFSSRVNSTEMRTTEPTTTKATTTTTTTTTEAPAEVTITLYAYSNHVEPKTDIKVSLEEQCVDLDRRWLRRVSSVDTHGSCIRMCQYKGCKGSCILVEPGSPYHNRLRILNFDKKTSSLKRC